MARSDLAAFAGQNQFDVVMYSHSYLAAALRLPGPSIVDFANVEAPRYRDFARTRRGVQRGSAYIEYLKARRWEPRVARTCTLATVLSDEDRTWAASVGANAVLVPNAADRPTAYSQSPAHGPALYLASMDYQPNAAAAEHLMDTIWPRVRAQRPEAELVIAGRCSLERLSRRSRPGVDIVGEVHDLEQTYRDAAVVVAPVTSGGGRQLKVIEAIGHGRVVVCSDYSLASVPESMRDEMPSGADPDGMATQIAEVMGDAPRRWRLEASLASAPTLVPTWDSSVRPVLEWLAAGPK